MAEYKSIPKEKFAFVNSADKLHDKKLETKPVGYFRDAFNRFKKNKGSIVAAIIVIIMILFSIIGPYCFDAGYQKDYATEKDMQRYQNLLPKLSFMEGTGIWDGSSRKQINQATKYRYDAMAIETGYSPIQKIYSEVDGLYDVQVNSYASIDCFQKTYTEEQYKELMAWQDETGIQVIMPYVNKDLAKMNNMNVWYVCDQKGTPKNGTAENPFVPAYYTYASAQGRRDDYTSKVRLPGDPYLSGDTANGWSYAQRTGTADKGYNYVVRVNAYNYFMYRWGFEPNFIFGSNNQGYDIFSRLASGARFSMLFALAVSAINLVIGAMYGAVEGYYGGVLDLAMERFSDILSAVPSMVVTVLFNLHLSAKVGVVPSLLYAFILTGWIGMASRTRMQFYRFKNQEYVMAARTLGARDSRLIWKHIFPNSLGTLITGSVLVIPGVIFSETSLTYLGIINLDSPTMSSVGAMLSAGQGVMTTFPHIVFFPALFIGLLMVSFNLFGNGLRDAFNPSLRGVED